MDKSTETRFEKLTNLVQQGFSEVKEKLTSIETTLDQHTKQLNQISKRVGVDGADIAELKRQVDQINGAAKP